MNEFYDLEKASCIKVLKYSLTGSFVMKDCHLSLCSKIKKKI